MKKVFEAFGFWRLLQSHLGTSWEDFQRFSSAPHKRSCQAERVCGPVSNLTWIPLCPLLHSGVSIFPKEMLFAFLFPFSCVTWACNSAPGIWSPQAFACAHTEPILTRRIFFTLRTDTRVFLENLAFHLLQTSHNKHQKILTCIYWAAIPQTICRSVYIPSTQSLGFRGWKQPWPCQRVLHYVTAWWCWVNLQRNWTESM